MTAALPANGPFALRGTVLTPLDGGGTGHIADGIVEVDERGRIAGVREAAGADPGAIDLRPHVLRSEERRVGKECRL